MLINGPADVAGAALDGLTRTADGVSRLAGSTATAIRSDVAEARAAGLVAVVSGGGAGHDPAHAGYVGSGMLTAAVTGALFTPPPPDAVLDAIRAAAAPAGALLVVPNRPADRLSFALAAEMARADGIDVVVVPVGDDVSRTGEGRRGLAGTVLVQKVAGAAAAGGRPLAQVAALARRAASAVGTMGVALGPCTATVAGVPLSGSELDSPLELGSHQGLGFAPGEVEWGPGASGEPGVGRGPIGSAYQVAARLIAAIVEDRGIVPGDRVALLVNGLGASSPTELSIMAEGAVRALRSWGVTPVRVWAGDFLTTLDMAGVSLSLLPVDDELVAALDAPTTAPAWPHTTAPAEPGLVKAPPGISTAPGELGLDHPVRLVLEAVAEALISVRDELTALDREAGDGDLGVSLALGAAAVLAECPAYPGADGPAAVLRAAADTVRRTVAGVSGPLYAILLLRAAAALPDSPGPRDWAAALRAGLDGVREAAGAEPGDRTMIDALAPAAATFADRLDAGHPWPEALNAAVDAATTGADATVDLEPRLGRAGYLGVRVLGYPDPGAQAVAIWLRAAATALHP
ncbi:dihydroxyacetone kinase family protein [Actinoplanes aureus]|uniref:Dihydroxyacetone kinase subunit DhaK n=1 Tax=Actinoplanes aureus TaxID=2792083 RepID=A0A931C933_9ACTN|nr:dihydroxyacetone kinase family protein [Actinoplanes aureus]MBG0565704.1 dihydroxyacetone kinase subunit DhaK [Actinoplanes aureus]